MTKEVIQKEIGVRIKELRENLDMTQEQLAKKVGYNSRSSINKIEIGDVDLSRSKISQLAKALNVSPAYLMGWESELDESKVSTLEKDFPEGVNILYRANEELTPEQKEKLISVINTVFFDNDGKEQ